MGNEEPSGANIAALAELLPGLRQVEANPIEWRGGDRQSDGTMTMPYAVYRPEAQQVLVGIDENNIIIDFDWQGWDWHPFLDVDAIRTASLLDIRRLLTVHARAERFNEGHFAEMITRGHIAAVLSRLAELAEERG